MWVSYMGENQTIETVSKRAQKEFKKQGLQSSQCKYVQRIKRNYTYRTKGKYDSVSSNRISQ